MSETSADEERVRKIRIMAEARERMRRRSEETLEIRQRRLADAIHNSIAEARPPVSVEEARAALRAFGPIKDRPTPSSSVGRSRLQKDTNLSK
jgi:hypothetical protein